MDKLICEQQQPEVSWQPDGDKVFVVICLNEKAVENQLYESTVYEYDMNQMLIQGGELDEETVRASPEKYLDYVPVVQKTDVEKLQDTISEQESQIQMLTDCLLEMSETLYQ